MDEKEKRKSHEAKVDTPIKKMKTNQDSGTSATTNEQTAPADRIETCPLDVDVLSQGKNTYLSNSD